MFFRGERRSELFNILCQGCWLHYKHKDLKGSGGEGRFTGDENGADSICLLLFGGE